MAVCATSLALLALLRLCGGSAGPGGGDPENYGRTELGMERCGLVSERHEVLSRDGYTTAAFRARRRGQPAPGGQPVILQHGILSSSDAWFQLEDRSLPCLLAAAGYDVWLPNSRGNSYSKAHNTYGTETLQFWAFRVVVCALEPAFSSDGRQLLLRRRASLVHNMSAPVSWLDAVKCQWVRSFHEMAVYDLAATIDYVRALTGAERVSLVGHGTGGTLALVLLSVLPEYNRRVRAAVSLAPVCFMAHTASHLLRMLAYTAPYFEKPLNWMTHGEIPPFPDPQRSTTGGFHFEIGAALGELIDSSQMVRREMWLGGASPGFLTDGTSLRTVLHLAQLVTRGNFSWYDFGKRNSVVYKRVTPPNYNLRRITATQVIMYSDADHLVVPEDAKRLCSELPEGVGVCYRVNKTGFTHSDFLSSYDAQEYVYNVLFGEVDSEPSETQRRPVGSQVRGRAAAAPEEDRAATARESAPTPLEEDQAAKDQVDEPSPERKPEVALAPGSSAAVPGRGRARNSAMQSRAPSSAEGQSAVVPPARRKPPTSQEEEWAAGSLEEEMVPKSPEWGTSETSAREEVVGRPTIASTWVSAIPSSARERTAASEARSRVASRVQGLAAGLPEPEGGVATSARPLGGGPDTPAPARTKAAAGEEGERDPGAPVEVCRYYAAAGRLQRICYEEYV